MAVYAVINASKALMPSQGAAAAWASLPKYSTLKAEKADVRIKEASGVIPGCEIRDTPMLCLVYAPAFRSLILPPPPICLLSAFGRMR